MYKCKVENRTNFKTIWNETRLTTPKTLQDYIDE